MADSLLDDGNQSSDVREEFRNKWKDKSKEEILEAKVESDIYIKTQNARFDEIRKDYLELKEQSTAKAQLQELIERQEKLLKGNPDTDTNTQGDVNQPSLKAEDIDTLLEQKLSAREKSTKQAENFNFVKAKLREQFGDNSNDILKQRMETLGLDQAFVDELAKTHPSVFLKTFGMDEVRQNGFNPPPRSSQRTDKFAPTTPKRDWNYYQELKKTNPRLYLDPKIAVQMDKDYLALGEAFGMPED